MYFCVFLTFIVIVSEKYGIEILITIEVMALKNKF
jgi:hypothetical protein